MIARDLFSIQVIQATVFVPDGIIRPSQVMIKTLEDMGEIYNGVPISVPIPDDMAQAIPSVILSSEDQTERLEVSRARITASWISQGSGVSLIGLQDKFTELARRQATISEQGNLIIGRIAGIVIRHANIPHPGHSIAKQFSDSKWLSGPFRNVEGFEVHAHSTVDLQPNLVANCWTRIKTSNLEEQRYHGVEVQQDINTLAEELATRHFIGQELLDAYKAIGLQIDDLFAAYFPDMET